MNVERFIPFIFIVLSLGLYRVTMEFPRGANIFPQLALGSIIFLSIIMGILDLKKKRQTSKPQNSGWWRPYIIFALTTLYIVSITYLGFFVSTSIFVIIIMFYLGLRNLSSYVVTLTVIMVFYYLLFIKLLHVPLPQGLIF